MVTIQYLLLIKEKDKKKKELDLSRYFGLAKCTLLPPHGLFHPVLPYRHAGKLTFPLCASCVTEEMSKPFLERTPVCTHTDSECQLVGTWCTPELLEAIEKGYTVVCVHEVWHFLTTRRGLFKDYVNTWLKIKEEASGWPSHVGDDPLKRQRHLDDYRDKEGIELGPEKIEKNPGLRMLAKMMLNSMWCKFGQRTNKTQVREFDDPQKFSTFCNSDTLQIKYVGIQSDDRVEVQYTLQEEDESILPNLNIFVACFTTCWARLKLYDTLDILQERVLYKDTDSVVFLSAQGMPEPPLGDYLGDFKDELSPDNYIVEFASGGPKNYGYKTHKGKEDYKVRGITLNRLGKRYVNFEVLKNNVLEDLTSPLESGEARITAMPIPYKIVRNAQEYQLPTTAQQKKYKLVYNKRVVNPHTFQTFPYGYERWTEEDAHLTELLTSL